MKFLTITSNGASWTQENIDAILSCLPDQLQVYTRELTDDQHSARFRLTTRFWRRDEYSISSLTIPFDQIDEEIAFQAMQLPNPAEIVLRAPSSNRTSHDEAHIALGFLGSFGSLVVATVIINSDRDVSNVLNALQDSHPGLTRLAVLVVPGCDLLSSGEYAKIELEDRMIRGLEGFTQLEHLVLDEGLICPLLLEALGRLHRLKHLNCMAGPFYSDSEVEVSWVLRSTLE